jgi:integrase
VRLLEPASTPQSAWRPLYARDAAIAVAASLLLALLVVWVVEFFNRSDAQPAIVMGRAWTPMAPGPERPPPLAVATPGLLPGVATLPRELDDGEVRALIEAAVSEARPALVALLSGLQLEEILALRGRDIDAASRQIRLPGRSAPLAEPLACLFDPKAEPDAPVFRKADGGGLTAEELEANVAFAAHDARLIQPEEVSAAALRHTYIAYLVRQGARFGDLGRLIGRLPAEAMAAYGPLAPPGAKRPLEEIDPILPALRRDVVS